MTSVEIHRYDCPLCNYCVYSSRPVTCPVCENVSPEAMEDRGQVGVVGTEVITDE